MPSLRFLGPIALFSLLICGSAAAQDSSLWPVYEHQLKSAKYIDLTHAFEPVQPVWPGFGGAKFKPSVASNDIEGFVKAGEEFTYEKHGFVASAYELTTDHMARNSIHRRIGIRSAQRSAIFRRLSPSVRWSSSTSAAR
jgi:hypothetical protein